MKQKISPYNNYNTEKPVEEPLNQQGLDLGMGLV